MADAAPPGPRDVRSYDDLSVRLRELRAWSGLSYRQIHRQVLRTRRERGIAEQPSYNSVYRCLQAGRSRLDVELVVDIAGVLLGDRSAAAEWRQMCQVAAQSADQAAVVSVSDRLPDEGGVFVGRAAELDQLLGGYSVGRPIVISAIDGMAGVGKTTLAVRAAHELVRRGRSPELQFFVNLRGFDADRPPADPAAVLDGFLRHLGVLGGRIQPLDLARRTAMFRELLAERHALIVLDNAASEDQVRPLLPDCPHCVVLVTSRRRLACLPAARVELPVFAPTESLELLTTASGRSEDAAAKQLVGLLGHLPLAVALLGGLVRATPDWTLADHSDRVRDRLSSFHLEDGVAVALRLSYDAMPMDRQQLLRLLALHPGRDLDRDAAAALVNRDPAEVEHCLQDLVAAHLVEHRRTGRYELHDLVRIFATERGQHSDPPRYRRSAITRLFDHYRHLVRLAMCELVPSLESIWPRVAPPLRQAAAITGSGAAREWLDAELANLTAMATYAADHRMPNYLSDLSALLFRYLESTGSHRAAFTIHGRAARGLTGDDQARACSRLGWTLWIGGRTEDASVELERALRIYDEAGTSDTAGGALQNLALVRMSQGRYPEAVELSRRAIETFRGAGRQVGLASTLANLALVYDRLGQDGQALAHAEQALQIFRDCGDVMSETRAMSNVGALRVRLGVDGGRELISAALAAVRDLGDRTGEWGALRDLGTVARHAGDHEAAVAHHEESLVIARELVCPMSELRSLLDLAPSLLEAGAPRAAGSRYEEALELLGDTGDPHERARAYEGLGQSRLDLGNQAEAAELWQRALDLYTEVQVPAATQLANRLAKL
ncbi:tetratricopeptide repeat protein [Kribbella sp. NPDC048928]|uniref:tetratricopeptide repeat protein n=1 Tax=Kribbella sp. NPDC048928 TaxID=3364111 RepID=UPI00370FCA63